MNQMACMNSSAGQGRRTVPEAGTVRQTGQEFLDRQMLVEAVLNISPYLSLLISKPQ